MTPPRPPLLSRRRQALRIALTLAWVLLLGRFFAQTEIQIEGPAGWAANLPTWRVEQHWLLDIFWGGRAMTGYHAWVFPFIALFFHCPFFSRPTPAATFALAQARAPGGRKHAMQKEARKTVASGASSAGEAQPYAGTVKVR